MKTQTDIITDRVFHKAKTLVETRYNAMLESGRLLLQVDVDKDEIWKTYSEGFTDPDLKAEHQCSACRNFIKSVGGLVTVDDNLEMTTLWDFRGLPDIPAVYLLPFELLDRYVRSRPIGGLFYHSERTAGADKSLDSKRDIVWQHFFAKIPPRAHNVDNKIGRQSAELRDSKNVLLRSITEITPEAIQTVRDLIAQNSLYRGAEYTVIVEQLHAAQLQYQSLLEGERDAWAWRSAHRMGPALSRARNTAIGTLLVDLSEGRELDAAVSAYEHVVAPSNYKRPTALVTPKMVQAAKTRLEELGLLSALDRRRLDDRDLTAAQALYVHRPVKVSSDVFSQLTNEQPVSVKSLGKVEEISIKDFVTKVLPTAKDIRVLVERSHLGNFVTLTGAQDPEAKNLMKWDNSFGWSYSGGVADSIKEKVKAAGGKVDGWMRVSLAWNNFDDLDLHFKSAIDHVYYAHKRSSQAWLDVDMNAGIGQTREPVENITCDKQLATGHYEIGVHQFARREDKDAGYTLEVEVNGEVHTFGSAKSPNSKGMDVVKMQVWPDGNVTFEGGKLTWAAGGVTKWGVKTGQFARVRAITLSPNHWTKPVGNKHWFFIIEGCISDEPTRPFYNEFLTEELAKDRKTTEALAGKITVAPAQGAELSGLGFSDTLRNHVYVEVNGTFKRHLKVLF